MVHTWSCCSNATVVTNVLVVLRLQVVNVRFFHSKEGVTSLALKVTRLGSVEMTRRGELVNVCIGDKVVHQLFLAAKVNVAVSAHRYLIRMRNNGLLRVPTFLNVCLKTNS